MHCARQSSPGWFAGAASGLVLALMAAPLAGADAPISVEHIQFFEKRVRPVLVQNCYECHSVEREKAKGGLLLDTRAALLKGGETGPAIVPGKPEQSLLVKAILRTNEDLQMPPKHKLDEQAIKDLVEWVRMGAPDPRDGGGAKKLVGATIEEGRKFWSFQPVNDPPVPSVKNKKWGRSPVDAFVRSKAHEKGLTPAPPADKRTLIRRATYDLTGLPPTPAEVDAFLANKSPSAFSNLVERLLASPAYGEHWGRHWLDVVRYADTAGCNSDFPVPPAYKYRNWVIRAIQADMPFDQFLREQIAGDLLPAGSDEERNNHIIATGYLAVSRRFASQTNEFYLTLDDTVDNLGKAMLGLSLGCARCHDHKYDPVPARDYYALYGIFKGCRYTFPGVEVVPNPRDYIPLGTADDVKRWKDYEAKLNDLDLELRRLEPLTRGSNAGTNDVEKIKAQMEEIKKQQKQMQENPPHVELAYGVQEGNPADARILKKGDPNAFGDVVPRGFLQVLGGQQLAKDAKESGRRELADWITDPKNPLTARVMVNRIWQYHFGKGLVQTPNDFGFRGKPPTHPELLDFLASRFIASGWSLKAMHRMLMLSSTYQMSSPDHVANAAKDVNNDYLWRFDRRRLSAEELRDTVLLHSGTLDRTVGGEHPFPPRKEWHYTQHTPFVADYPSDKRSVYLMQQRIRRNPFLETWDGADPAATTGVRSISTTPIQALYMMNDSLIHEQSRKFARRMLDAAPEDAERIRRAHLELFSRPPTRQEIRDAKEYLGVITIALREAGTSADQLAEAAWASYSRVLFGSNEFIFVD